MVKSTSNIQIRGVNLNNCLQRGSNRCEHGGLITNCDCGFAGFVNGQVDAISCTSGSSHARNSIGSIVDTGD